MNGGHPATTITDLERFYTDIHEKVVRVVGLENVTTRIPKERT